jgi:glycosyltransferase involved in cell wall biosynthesis
MPFIEPVLRNAEPFMDRMLVTISEKSDDGTLGVLRGLEREFKNKLRIDFENVPFKGALTAERQKQIQKTSEDWVLFLDDDDWWPKESLEEMVKLINKGKEVDAYAVSPYQVVSEKYYDHRWYDEKFFTKWFKNEGINYRYLWPKDLIFKEKAMLYWKRNPRVIPLKGKYLHLAWVKDGSFREEDWTKGRFKEKVKNSQEYPDDIQKHVWEIFDWKATH